MSTDWTRLLLPLVPVIASLIGAHGLYHFFQLESYQFPGYFKAIRRNWITTWLPGLTITVVSLAMFYGYDRIFASGVPAWLKIGFALLLLPLSVLLGLGVKRSFSVRATKKKFVFTGRVKRLFGTSLVCMGILSFALAATPLAILPTLWPLALPLIVALCGLLAWPLEKAITECYFRDARRKLLRNPKLVRIGITGSYGKTSVKHIVGAILAEKYPTLITPASFNTPMGVSRAIRERLTPSHQIFVGEMGARHVGDIKELCRLVRPTIGILTSVGPQHLDTFKTVDRVAKGKYELIEALPADGHAYFCEDHGICRGLYDRTQKPKTLIALEPGDADVWCENISVSQAGCAFDLHIREKGSIHCQTRLLGEHNIINILTAAAVASDLGVNLKQISNAVGRLQPVKSRLELIASPGSFTIINDAFNSNPVGSKAALKVLAQFPSRRIIITPGMVELGAQEAELNRAFGRAIASSADIAIIVGKKRVLPLLEGIRQAGFPEENLYRVDSLAESTTLLRSMVRKDDTVLYENDLPDQYQEV